LVDVDSDAISHVTERCPNPGRFQWQDIGTVRGGDWDRGDQLVAELPVVHALRERFEHGSDWEVIEFIQHVIEQAEDFIITSTDEFR